MSEAVDIDPIISKLLEGGFNINSFFFILQNFIFSLCRKENDAHSAN